MGRDNNWRSLYLFVLFASLFLLALFNSHTLPYSWTVNLSPKPINLLIIINTMVLVSGITKAMINAKFSECSPMVLKKITRLIIG